MDSSFHVTPEPLIVGQTPECSVKVTRQMEQAQPPSCKSAQSLSWAGWGADGGGCILPHPRPHLSIWWELVQNQSSSHLGLINNVLAENLLLLLLEASPAPPKEPVTCIRLGIHALGGDTERRRREPSLPAGVSSCFFSAQETGASQPRAFPQAKPLSQEPTEEV